MPTSVTASMSTTEAWTQLTYQERLDLLREKKLAQTEEKRQVIGAMDHDDWALILPPPELRKTVQAVSGSGVPITDVLIDGVEMESNHANGSFYGPSACGRNFRRLLDAHPPYVDPLCSIAGSVMANYSSYRTVGWNPDYDFSHLQDEQEKYGLVHGIGGSQHFCPDLTIGFQLGWAGLLSKIAYYRDENGPSSDEFYVGLEEVIYGIQDWMRRNADEARRLAGLEENPQLRTNLETLADINDRLVTEPPQTFHEACQWMTWYLMAARMYNGSGALGRLDMLLQPFYEADVAAGRLTDEEATFHIACSLLRDTTYAQLGGPDSEGNDVTSRISYLVLDAVDQLKVPANIGVSVGPNVDPGLLSKGVEIQFEHKMGFPKFLGVDSTVQGLIKNGYPAEIARLRAYSGCHWCAVPGREYAMRDIIKINFATIFQIALRETVEAADESTTVDGLWQRFDRHLRRAVEVTAEGLAFHLEHMHKVFPELVLDLLCDGPLEKGDDASHGSLEIYNIGIDGAALATVADSIAAIEQRVEDEGLLSWQELMDYLENDWDGPQGERARLMMKSVPSYGAGGTRADDWAKRIARSFTQSVREVSNEELQLTPGLFSWAATLSLGRALGATPDGRNAGDPISHGSNPNPGFREDGATTAMAIAIAGVQPGLGNSAPMQLELDPGLSRSDEDLQKVGSLIRTHFDLGGTQINLNVLDKEKVLEAHADPSKHPDLIVRVTGFSAYFASLSPEFRQIVVDRIIAES